MALRNGQGKRKNAWKKRAALVTLSILLLAVLCSSLPPSSVPSLVTPAAAIFSSITITEVRPTEFSPGETSVVTVTVKNNGGRDARDIRVVFQGTDDLALVGATVAHINTLGAWSSKELQITVHVADEAPNGAYFVPVTASWREYYFDPAVVGYVTGPEETAQLGLSFSVRGNAMINVGAVTTDPQDIRPGTTNIELRVFIENSGEAAAKDIEAQLLFTDTAVTPSWSGTERSYLGRLNSGERGEAIFHIDLAERVDAGQQDIPVQLRYTDTKGQAYEITRTVSLLVKPKPDFEIVSYTTEPGTIAANTRGVVLRVMIRNSGTENAESVSLRLTGEAKVPFTYDVKSDLVGNLEIGAAGEAVLKFDVKSDAVPKDYPVGIEIRCTGDRTLGDDNVYVFAKEIKVAVAPGTASKGSGIPGFEVHLAALALALVVLLGARRRRST